MTFNDFVHKHTIKTTSNIKINQVISYLGLSDAGIFLGDEPFQSEMGIVILHPTKGTQGLGYINENCFDSYGCVRPKKLSKFTIK